MRRRNHAAFVCQRQSGLPWILRPLGKRGHAIPSNLPHIWLTRCAPSFTEIRAVAQACFESDTSTRFNKRGRIRFCGKNPIMILRFIYLCLALMLLFAGAEGLVRGGSSLALRAGLSRLMAGLTIVHCMEFISSSCGQNPIK